MAAVSRAGPALRVEGGLDVPGTSAPGPADHRPRRAGRPGRRRCRGDRRRRTAGAAGVGTADVGTADVGTAGAGTAGGSDANAAGSSPSPLPAHLFAPYFQTYTGASSAA